MLTLCFANTDTKTAVNVKDHKITYDSKEDIMVDFTQWDGFEGRIWKEEVNTRDFIQKNYTPYDGDSSFLVGPTDATNKLWGKLQELQKEERAKGGVLDMDTDIVSTLTSHKPGYISEDHDLEKVVGLQTDKPLKRAFMPFGGIKMAEDACKTNGYEPSPELHKIFTEYSRTHNQGVFDAYTPEMKKARHNKIITGLPDTYGRGRIVGDYRRVALYGLDFLIEAKKKDFANCGDGVMTDDVIRQREEITLQIRALNDMKTMAESYGFDISKPASNAKEAVQWLYFGYLAAIKTQNGAAMSVGRVSTFLDIYIKRDLEKGILTEEWLSLLVFLHTISSSQATLYGQHWKSAVSALMDVQWLLRPTTDSSTLLKIWVLHQSQTLQFFTHQLFLTTSSAMLLRSLLQQAQFSTKTMT